MQYLKVLIQCMVFTSLSFSLSLNEINANISNVNSPPALDVQMTTTIVTNGVEFSTQTHQISKGSDKFWMETRSSIHNQRMIKNNGKIQTIDLNTNKRSITNVPIGEEELIQNSISMVSSKEYSQPVHFEGDMYVVKRIAETDTSLHTESLKYDSKINKFVEVFQISKSLDTSITTFSYCDTCEYVVPRKIEIAVNGKSDKNNSRVTIEYTQILFPKYLKDGMFKFED